MTHSAFRQHFYQQLTSLFLQGELMAMYHWCAEEIHGWNRHQLYLHNDEEIASKDFERWSQVVECLKTKEPVQYIFNKAFFRNLALFVDTNVLIPRPETEELTQLVLDRHKEAKLRVLDMGTGSGCIALALKTERPGWEVSGCDVSEGALEVANQNATNLKALVQFFHYDIGSTEWIAHDTPDVIVSNPPYIREKSKEEMEGNVLNHEPHLALFAPANDPFYFFRTIARHAAQAKVSEVHFETEAKQIDELVNLLKQEWSGTIEVHNDLAAKPRFVCLLP